MQNGNERHRKLLREWMTRVGEKRMPLTEVQATKPAEGRRAKPGQEKKSAAQPATDDE